MILAGSVREMVPSERKREVLCCISPQKLIFDVDVYNIYISIANKCLVCLLSVFFLISPGKCV